MTIDGVAVTTYLAIATSGTFFLGLPNKGVLRHISVGDFDNSCHIHAVIFVKQDQGINPLLIANEDVEEDTTVMWNGELDFKGYWRLKVIFTEATVGDRIGITALVDT